MMQTGNPYESPATDSAGGNFRPRFDAGKLAAAYLQILAVGSVIAMVAGLVFFDRLNIDLSPLFLFWAAKHLRKHGNTARKWVLGICYLVLTTAVLMFVLALCVGTENFEVRAFGAAVEQPKLWHVGVVSLILSVPCSIPIWILSTPEAKREFEVGLFRGIKL